MDKNIENKVETPFGWQRNLVYFKTNIILMLKTLVEYKANLYGSILEQIIYYLVQFLFFFVIATSFGDVIGWTLIDFIIFAILIDLVKSLAGILIWKENLDKIVPKGNLNQFLTKPMPIFNSYLFSKMNPPAFFYVITSLVLLLILLFYIEFQILNLILVMLVFLSLAILFLAIFLFFDSLSLRVIGLGKVFLMPYRSLIKVTTNYPSNFFKSFQYDFILFFSALFFIGSLLIPLLRSYEFMFNPFLQVGIIFGLIIIFGMGTWINWHFGLKKYEAFG